MLEGLFYMEAQEGITGPLSITLTCLPYSCQVPNSSVQYHTHSVVRMKCGGLVTEEAVERRRARAVPTVMESKFRRGMRRSLLGLAHRILQKNVRGTRKCHQPNEHRPLSFHPWSSKHSAGRYEHKCEMSIEKKKFPRSILLYKNNKIEVA